MGLFSSLVDAATSIVAVPVAVVKDTVTLGGLATGERETYTERQARKAAEAVEEVVEELDDLL